MEWVQAVAQVTQGEVVAIDGKTVRRSHDRTLGKKAIHMVNVWASSQGLALGQTKVDEKSNEITAIPKLLQLLEFAGCSITIDAMGCQREIAREIIEAQADYLLAVKENQGRLYDDVRDLFEGAEEYDFEGVPHDFARTLNKSHGRLGKPVNAGSSRTRTAWTICKTGSSGPTSTPWLRSRLSGRRQPGPRSTLATISAVWPGLPRLCWRSPPTLGHRKQLALVFGCYLWRRSQPGT